MAKTTRNLVAAAATVAALLGGDTAVAAEPKPTRIVLRVCDSWQLAPASLARVQTEVSGIYNRIGVDVIWTAPDGSKNDAHNLTVIILSREMGLTKIAKDAVQDGTLGQAAKVTGYAYIFTQRVSDISARHGLNFEKTLGKVIAHEVGHLLLTDGHSDFGIMQRALQVRNSASEWFTPVQGATIRAELANPANGN